MVPDVTVKLRSRMTTALSKLSPACAAVYDQDVIEDRSDLIRSRESLPASDNTQTDMSTTNLQR